MLVSSYSIDSPRFMSFGALRLLLLMVLAPDVA